MNDHQDDEEELFGPLLAIPEKSLFRPASDTASQTLHFIPSSGGKLVARISGSYNISHVAEPDGGERKIIKLMIRVSASAHTARGYLALCPPDFYSQYVLVDDHDTVTALIDLDLARTMSRFVGCARCPSLITRDRDPLLYGWPKSAESKESRTIPTVPITQTTPTTPTLTYMPTPATRTIPTTPTLNMPTPDLSQAQREERLINQNLFILFPKYGNSLNHD